MRVGPFLVRFEPDDASPLLNYAVPDDGAWPSTDDLASLAGTALLRRRSPRVEWFPAAAPSIERIVADYGFNLERRLPVLSHPLDRRRSPAVPNGISILAVHAEVPEDVAGAALAANVGFDEPPPDKRQLRRLRRSLSVGGTAVLARDRHSGAPVGSARLDPPIGGVTELLGASVVPSHRRRGVASALIRSLLGPFCPNGVELVWLCPEDEAAESFYAALGFTTISLAYHASLPVPAARGRSAVAPLRPR